MMIMMMMIMMIMMVMMMVMCDDEMKRNIGAQGGEKERDYESSQKQ